MRIFKELKQKDSALLATHSLEVKLPPLPYPLLHNEDYILSNKVKKYARCGIILYLLSAHISGAYFLE